MKNFILAAFLFLAAKTFAETPKNEIPLYGEAKKTKEELALDEKFINEVSRIAGDRKKAAAEFTKKGWDAIAKGNQTDAIKRFNQAHLLDSKEYQVYWGLGIASGMNGKPEEAIKLFEKGYQLNQKDSRFVSDFGFAYVNSALALDKLNKEKAFQKLDAAQAKYHESLKIDPKQSLSYSRLAVLDYYRGDFKTAWKNINLSKQNGGEGLDQRFLSDLEKASAG